MEPASANSIVGRLRGVERRIRLAAGRCERPPGDIRLLAVSKTRPAEDIRTLAAAGQRAFAESYVQEAVEKIAALADLGLEWHFIGPIQSNKTRQIAENFDWVHSVDRLKIARRLSEQRPPGSPPLQVCLQVNIGDEPTKSGVSPGDLADLAGQVRRLPGLQLRGLMAIPVRASGLSRQRRAFAQLRELQQSLRAGDMQLDTLSMGMTGDLEAAIMEGATMVRVGTGLFGPRN